jgi:hypothetical protein
MVDTFREAGTGVLAGFLTEPHVCRRAPRGEEPAPHQGSKWRSICPNVSSNRVLLGLLRPVTLVAG